jgi:hypothetical protein
LLQDVERERGFELVVRKAVDLIFQPGTLENTAEVLLPPGSLPRLYLGPQSSHAFLPGLNMLRENMSARMRNEKLNWVSTPFKVKSRQAHNHPCIK